MEANGGGDLWLLLTVGGVVVLGLAIAYAMMRSRRTTAHERQLTEQGAAKVYDAEQREASNR